MDRLWLVGAGGALGALARYGLSAAQTRWGSASAFPISTATVNLSGGLAMGLLAGWLAMRAGGGSEALRLFVATGVLGGFTTFSAYSLEIALMIERRDLALAVVYALGSVLLSVLAIFAGLWLSRRLWA